jgi:hypothetical protein
MQPPIGSEASVGGHHDQIDVPDLALLDNPHGSRTTERNDRLHRESTRAQLLGK